MTTIVIAPLAGKIYSRGATTRWDHLCTDGCVGKKMYNRNKTECEVHALAVWCYFILLVLVIATQMENSGIFIVLLETLEQTHKVCYYVGNVVEYQ